MAENTNELSIPIGADPSGLRQGFQEAENIVNRSVSNIERSVQRIGNLGADLAKLGTALSASITLPLVALAKESVQAYGEIQALQKGLEAVSGSASFAAKQFRDLQQVAKLPGLGLKEAVKGSINLQAIGYSASSAEKILLQFGNAVATVGKGRVEFDRAIYGVTQLANTDFPLGEDLNIIKDALPQVSTLLKAAFGTSRTEDLQKLKVSSKAVMDVILTGLEKLPRVNGGIKNAFENLGDSIQQSLGRIGKVIDDRLNISALIDKLTAGLDRLISAFEDLSPGMQKTILVIAGIVAGIGPLLVIIGGALAALPLLTAGFAALGTTLTYLLTIITPLNIVLGVLAYGLYDYYIATERASDRQERFSEALAKSTISAKAEVSELEKLYKASQDQTLSVEEKNKAVDQLQKQYPFYFANLSNEAILAGKAGDAYKSLTIDIVNASKARAAQAELDKRNTKRLDEELQVREKLTKAYRLYNNASAENLSKFNKEGLFTNDTISVGGGVIDQLNASEADIKAATKKYIQGILDNYNNSVKAANREDAPVLKVLENGLTAINNLDTPGKDTFLPGLDKVKKETEKQLSEIIPRGSIADYQKRADLLRKSIEYTNDGLVKVRGLDKFGKDVDKKGNPYYTGLVLPIKEAYEELEKLDIVAGNIDLPAFKINTRGLLDNFGNEFATLNDLFFDQTTKFADGFNRLPKTIKLGIDNALIEAKRLQELTTEFNKSLSSLVTDSISSSINDLFSSIGKAIGEGGNVISAIGSSLLSAFSGFLSEMGKLLIKYGVLAVTKGTLDLIIQTGGYQAIVAGVAAIAVGAALSIAGSALGSAAKGGMSGNISSSSGVSSGNSYSGSYTSGGSFQGGEIVLRASGPDLVAVINRNVLEQDRLTAG